MISENEQAAQRRLATRHGLGEELGGIDPVAGIGVDHEALLVAGDDLELLGFIVEQPAVDALDVLDQRDLGVQAGFGLGVADDGAELADQYLLGRVDGVEGLGHQEDGNGDRDQGDDGTVGHRVAPGAGGVVVRGGGEAAGCWPDLSSGSGR